MSASCDRAIDVEDLVLGLVYGKDADALEAHVDACADCQEVKAMFVAERALFEARPARAEPPPLALPKPALGRVYRLVPALVVAAACVAVFVGRPRADDCDPPAPVVATSADDALGPGICRAPEAPAPAVSLASHDTNACVPSPNATCDVTFSTATP